MVVNLIKFIHLIFVLGLLGPTIYCLVLIGSKRFTEKYDIITRLNKAMLIQLFFATLTGTLLVYPKHFTFHTPWIQAAYILVTLFAFSLFSLILLKNKRQYRILWLSAYFVLTLILIAVIHDAVTKTTFLPIN